MLFSEVSKKQAFLTHFSISFAIFLLLAYLIVFQWYPSYYFNIDGGDRGLATIFFVDVVLGPGLTLLVFRQGKKGLKLDMILILLFQIIALSWGIKSVYISRPALTVFYDGRFVCLPHDEIDASIVDRLSVDSAGGPVLAFLRRPDTFDGYIDFMKTASHAESSEIYYYTDRYETINESSIKRIKSYKLDMDEAIEKNTNYLEINRKNWAQYIEQNPASDKYMYMPLICRYDYVTAVFDLEQGVIADYVNVSARWGKSDIKMKLELNETQLKEVQRLEK